MGPPKFGAPGNCPICPPLSRHCVCMYVYICRFPCICVYVFRGENGVVADNVYASAYMK